MFLICYPPAVHPNVLLKDETPHSVPAHRTEHIVEHRRVPAGLQRADLRDDVIADLEHAGVTALLVQAVVRVELAQLAPAEQVHQLTLFRVLSTIGCSEKHT